MKKIVLIPDSFKGTMSSLRICEIMRDQILLHDPQAEIISVPVADGGEGSVDCFLSAIAGVKITSSAQNPLGEEMQSFYGVIDHGKTAVIEMAACAGLPLIEDRLNPLVSSTYGVGMLMKNAIESGVDKIILGLGGSATNDGGCGAAAALGVRFYNFSNQEFIPAGGTLTEIDRIDVSQLDARLNKIELVAMCDIESPMAGEKGASFMFGPQKGATAEMLPFLDEGVRHLGDIILRDLGKDVRTLPGGGAAGAMGAGVAAFFDAKLKRGIDVVLDTVHFEEIIQDADLIFTGEGKIDAQSLQGKVVIGVAERARLANVPVIAIVGDIADPIEEAYQKGVTAVFSINRMAIPFSEARKRAEKDLSLTVGNLMRQYKGLGL
ncbi:glycerate kinase family protein [Scatolibacter rhodanostii]|uniref:glycerate kinase family protein n=1 Tax=Scatolibacter rhodanostii TaxID=2014781 RepID=UPI000C070E3B|nr:glycerate kinase [Scatolibacter rhodanostii]